MAENEKDENSLIESQENEGQNDNNFGNNTNDKLKHAPTMTKKEVMLSEEI